MGAHAALCVGAGGYHYWSTVRIGEGSCEVGSVKGFLDICDIWFSFYRKISDGDNFVGGEMYQVSAVQ